MKTQYCSIRSVQDGITMSTKISSPLLLQMKHISLMKSAREYKTVASTSMRTIGIMEFFVARNVDTLHSIIQTRYASNPRYIESELFYTNMQRRAYLNSTNESQVLK